MISTGAMNGWFAQALKQQLEWLQKKKGADIKVLLRAKQKHQNRINRIKLIQFEAMPRRNYWKNAGSGFWTIARTNGLDRQGILPMPCRLANRQDPENGKEFPEKCLSQRYFCETDGFLHKDWMLQLKVAEV